MGFYRWKTLCYYCLGFAAAPSFAFHQTTLPFGMIMLLRKGQQDPHNQRIHDSTSRIDHPAQTVLMMSMRNIFVTVLYMATSSSELKKMSSHKPVFSGSKTTDSNVPRNSVVRRLKKAASLAVEAKKIRSSKNNVTSLQQGTEKKPTTQFGNSSPLIPSLPVVDSAPTLRQLTKVLDRHLLHHRTLRHTVNANTFNSPSSNAPPDSMGALFMHNHIHPRTTTTGVATSTTTTKHVALLLAKPIKDDLLTIEGAARARHLLQSMVSDHYHPHLIVFCGSTTGNNRVNDADASYLYFRNLLRSASASLPQGALLQQPEFYIERTLLNEGVLRQTVAFIQKSCIQPWWEEVLLAEVENLVNNEDSKDDILSSVLPKRRPKIHIHFSIFSSEYHLCQLNNIHVRSPNQSILRALRVLEKRPNTDRAAHVDSPTWSFHTVSWSSWLYAPNFFLSSSSSSSENISSCSGFNSSSESSSSLSLRAFCAKTYNTAQDMVPVLYNLRGVIENKEFFQRDNYLSLVASRRSLIADMERMYHLQPGLQAVHSTTTTISENSFSSYSSSLSTTFSAEHLSYSSSVSSTTAAASDQDSDLPTSIPFPASSQYTTFLSSSSLAGSASVSSLTTGSTTTMMMNPPVVVGSTHSRGSSGSNMNAQTNHYNNNNNSQNNKPLDVALESALLSLALCLDLVRPAGLLTGSVSKEDYKRALSSLQQAYYLLDRACDPDEPLSAQQGWNWNQPPSPPPPPPPLEQHAPPALRLTR